MKKYRRFGASVLVATLLALLTACTTTRTTVGATDAASATAAPTEMYPLTAEQADQVVVKSMTEQFGDAPLIRVDAPYKGYTVHTYFLLDSHRFTARMIPAKGQSQNGKVVDGYVFDVIDSGTMLISGQIRAESLITRLYDNAKLIAKPVPIIGNPKEPGRSGASGS